MSESRERGVLIADAHAERARGLAELLEARGVVVARAVHGVEALERALADGPCLVVASQGLPLVDAPRLADLLSSNPRTSDANFLYLGEPLAGEPFEPGIGDEQRPATLRSADVARVVFEMLEKRDRLARIGDASDDGEAGQGTLEQVSARELVGLLHQGSKTGRLELFHDDPSGAEQDGTLDVRAGEVVAASSGTAKGEKALFRMLTWRSGQFRFGPARDDGDPQAQIVAPTRAVLSEGLRQVAEWDRLATQLPQLEARIRLSVRAAELPAGVHPLTQEVLALLDLYTRVGDVVEACTFPDYQVLRTLHTLSERGLVTISRGHIAPQRTAAAGLFAEAQRRRLREWIRDSQGRPRSPRDAKLLVAASDSGGAADFANLLRPLDGATLDPDVERSGPNAGRVQRLARLCIDPDFGIELVHVPAAPRFAPLWPIAAHGSLGVLFLLSGTVGEAVSQLAPMIKAVQSLPRARVFHAVLLRKGERVSPDELRDHLALIDEGSLILLPLESAKDPSSLLSTLFARVVP